LKDALLFYFIFHIHRHAGLEFHSEFVLKDGDIFNQPPDQRLIVLSDGSRLLPKNALISAMRFF
jgi:hypothetical protein